MRVLALSHSHSLYFYGIFVYIAVRTSMMIEYIYIFPTIYQYLEYTLNNSGDAVWNCRLQPNKPYDNILIWAQTIVRIFAFSYKYVTILVIFDRHVSIDTKCVLKQSKIIIRIYYSGRWCIRWYLFFFSFAYFVLLSYLFSEIEFVKGLTYLYWMWAMSTRLALH